MSACSRWRGTALMFVVMAIGNSSSAPGHPGYFPEGVALPIVDRSLPSHLNPDDAHWKDPSMPEHNARFLPANHTYARWLCCPWACFIPSLASSGLLREAASSRTRGAGALKMSAAQYPKSGRRFVLATGVGLALGGYALGGRPAVAGADSAVAGANSAVGAAASIKDLMQAAEKEREAKKAAQAALPKRPTELRDRETCFTWNGEKYCTSCMKGCTEHKKTFKDIDCEKYCTVEYGSPKPTDEESVSFSEFVASVNKSEVTRVDFYGSNGDKAYATYKSGTYIRIGEGFPIEIGNEQSSPLQVVRLLNANAIPYKFHFLENIKYRKMGAP